MAYGLHRVKEADVVIVTVQSTYHETVYRMMAQYLKSKMVVVCICSYMSSFYLTKYCMELPMIAETTGPYLEGRIELDDKPGEVVFRVGCRLTRSPLSVYHKSSADKCMEILHKLNEGFANDYSVIESALLNPNMVLHTVGAIMSIPRIEYSEGNFCMYREAYSMRNGATMNLMYDLDFEKMKTLMLLGGRRIDIFEAGGFLGEDRIQQLTSFFKYSESEDRAISPTSVRSRYITEDVSQGLVLLESIAKEIGVDTPITTSLINIAGAALDKNFRSEGRTIERLGAVRYIQHLHE